MTSPLDVEIVAFENSFLNDAVKLSSAAGWAHRREDWSMMQPFSAGVAALQNERLVGTAFRSDFGGAVSTVNMIIVDKELRGRGLGHRLVTSAIGTEPGTLRLVATVEGRPLYEKLGFDVVDTIACVRGITTNVSGPSSARDATEEDLPDIAAMESASFGGDRTALIKWFWQAARLAVVHEGGAVRAYAGCRRFGAGYVIGPVVAPDAEVGLAVIRHLAKSIPGHILRIDVTVNSGLQDGLGALGLAPAYTAPVMQRGNLSANSERLAVFSQAFG